jgi:putative transcriptional regulator
MARPKKIEMPLTELEQDLLQSAQDMLAHARGEKKFPTYSYNAPANVDVKEVRSNLHLTQEEFASFIGASVHAVRHWENGRRTPDGTARTLLCVLKANPNAVLAALNHA